MDMLDHTLESRYDVIWNPETSQYSRLCICFT